MEVTIDNLSDMCALMCDNVVPQKGESMEFEWNDKGKSLYEKFEQYYYDELAKLRKEKKDPEYIEGWCIIDNEDYVRTLEDVCGILIYGDDDFAFQHLDDFIKQYGEDEVYDCGYTAREVRDELLKYCEEV